MELFVIAKTSVTYHTGSYNNKSNRLVPWPG